MKKLILMFILGFVSFPIITFFIPKSSFSPREALPMYPEYIEEHNWDDGFISDYAYTLKAKISTNDFHWFIDKMKLTDFKQEEFLYEKLEEDRDFKVTASYENGMLTYQEDRW